MHSLCSAWFLFCLCRCFFFASVHRFAVRGLVFVCVFILETACGSVFRILQIFSGVVPSKLQPLFCSFLCCANLANLQSIGGCFFYEALYEAAKIIFTHISNCARLASTLVKLQQFQAAVDAARKANIAQTWKEVCFACVDAEEFCLAYICGLNVIVQIWIAF